MKRQEFIDNINTWEALIQFCGDNRLSFFDGTEIVNKRQMKDIIFDTIIEITRHHESCEIFDVVRDYLDSIQYGFQYYMYDENLGEYIGLDRGRFQEFKNIAIATMDSNDMWEPEVEIEMEITLEELFFHSQHVLEYTNNQENPDEISPGFFNFSF